MLDRPRAGEGHAGSLELSENHVHLWVADHRVRTNELDACWALLDADERDRASRFRFHEHFRRFVFGHARLRTILALYSGTSADELHIARRCEVCGPREHGKPFLVAARGEPATIRFSCSCPPVC